MPEFISQFVSHIHSNKRTIELEIYEILLKTSVNHLAAIIVPCALIAMINRQGVCLNHYGLYNGNH